LQHGIAGHACHLSRFTENDNRVFKLLQDTYVGARYNTAYNISKGELMVMAARVNALTELLHNTLASSL